MESLGTTKQLVFDGKALRSVGNGVFSWVFRASAKHTLAQNQHAFGSPDALSMWRSLREYLTQQKSSPSSDDQRQILLKLQNGNDVHLAQSKQRFWIRDRAAASESQFDYERTGWRQRDRSTGMDPESRNEEEGNQLQQRPTSGDQDSIVHEETPMTAQAEAMKLIILGTGSAAPSKLRGSTGIYLELKTTSSSGHAPSSNGEALTDSMLIDCGEGTYGQLWRQFGNATAARIGGLRCVWISHSHADHQCGLVRILYEYVRFHTLRNSCRQGLLIIAPQSVLSYASSWVEHIFDSCGVEPLNRPSFFGFATCRDFNQRHHPFRAALFSHIGLVIREISSVPVWHCYDSYGLVVQLQNGQKIVYSGDTRPCNQLVAAGAKTLLFLSCCRYHASLGGTCHSLTYCLSRITIVRIGMHASLLIHEATFDDSMEEDAVKKKHSTVGEALEIARRMHAQEVILTHFSQRYPKLPPPLMATTTTASADEGGKDAKALARVQCAFDGYIHHIPI